MNLNENNQLETYILRGIKEVSNDCCNLTFSYGPSFYLRTIYCEGITNLSNRINIGEEFSAEEYEEFVEAGLAYIAERKAMDLLSRSEHSRFLLFTKMIKKGYDCKAVNKALDYLENRKYLSDRRFAEAWLRNRSISHSEGRIRLYNELLSRGVSSVLATEQIDDFFISNSEEEILKKACKKLMRLGKKDDNLYRALIRKGFSSSLIKIIDLNDNCL